MPPPPAGRFTGATPSWAPGPPGVFSNNRFGWSGPREDYRPLLRPAGLVSRFIAAMFDAAIGCALAFPFFVAYVSEHPMGCGDFGEAACVGSQPTHNPWVVPLAILATLTFWTYYAIFDGRGGTIGRRLMGLRLVDAGNGTKVGFTRAFFRAVAKIISALACYMGFLSAAWDRRHQAWHDKMVGSVVVRYDPGLP